MAQETEAACLLQKGALYTDRLGLRDSRGTLIFAGFKAGAFSLYFDDEPISHFDLEGRWQRAYIEGIHYLKGLDTRVQSIDRVREGANMVLRRRTLSFAEATDLDDLIRSQALDLLSRLEGGFDFLPPPSPKARPIPPDVLRSFLERIASWDAPAWFRQRERYLGLYGPLPFHPPEAATSILLQVDLGHAGPSFGNDRIEESYRRSIPEFEDHVRSVRELWGRRIAQAKFAYLAGSNVWHRPLGEIAACLDVTAGAFPIGTSASGPDRLDGVIGFLDDFTPSLPDADGWRSLRDRSLARMVAGIESGDRGLREFYGKTWDDGVLRAIVADWGRAGMVTSLVVLVGAGGVESADRHLEKTASLLESLELAKGCLVYLVDADEVGGETARERLQGSGASPIVGAAFESEVARFKERLAAWKTAQGVKVVPYSLDKQGLS